MSAARSVDHTKGKRQRWKKAAAHGVPIAAAIVITALVTSALEPVRVVESQTAAGLNAVWAPQRYQETLAGALTDFVRPLEQLLGVATTPRTPWQQSRVGDAPATSIVGATYRQGAHRANTVLRSGANAGGAGLVPWETFDSIPLTTDTTAIVDQGNGNLTLRSIDGNFNTAGVPLSVDRYFNSVTAYAGSLGGQWSTPLSGFDTGLTTSGTNRYYVAPSGNSERFTPDGSGGWVQPPSFNAVLTTTATGATLVLNATGERLTFNASGWLVSDVDKNGLGNTYTYDASGQVSNVAETTGMSYTLAWSTTNPSFITSVTDSANRVTTYTHDSSGRLTRVDSPGSYWETYAYNAAGLVSHIEGVGPNSSTTIMDDITYDSANRLLSISQGTVGSSIYARTTSYSGWGASSTVSVTDGNGNITQRGISASNVPISSTDPLGRKASWTHNANGDVVSYTAPGATTPTKLTYNNNNSLTSSTAPTGATVTSTYGTTAGCSGSGGTAFVAHCTTDAAGDQIALQYDANGNVLKTTDTTGGGTGSGTSYVYATPSGGCYTSVDGGQTVVHGLSGELCAQKSPNGSLTTYEYDAVGNQTAVNGPAPLGRTTATYDALGRETSATDGNGKTTRYTYNVRDDLVSTAYDGGAVLTTTWTPNGLESGTSMDATNKDSYTYDVLGQMLTEYTRHNNVSKSLTYTYDKVGNLLTYTDQYGIVTYNYDTANQLTQMIEPGGSCGSGTPAASSGCITFTYDLLGDETSRTFPGGATMVTTRDAGGRQTRITAKTAAGATVYDKGYNYSLGGVDTQDIQNTTSYVETGVPAGATTAYSYDSLARLTGAIETAGTSVNASWAYNYDDDGNRTKQVLTGAVGTAAGASPTGTTTATYNAADQLTSTSADIASWSYDANGQQLTNGITGAASGYNDRKSTVSAGTGSYVTYGAGNGQTYARTDGSTTTNFTNSSILGLMGEDSGTQRIYDRTPDGTAVGSRLSAGSRYYFIQDALGSVVGIFDKDGGYYGGYTYGPYGEARFTSANSAMSNNHLRYISGYYDVSSGLYRLGDRYYDPSVGRFQQEDPIEGGNENAYNYPDDPINNTDPTGDAGKGGSRGRGGKKVESKVKQLSGAEQAALDELEKTGDAHRINKKILNSAKQKIKYNEKILKERNPNKERNFAAPDNFIGAIVIGVGVIGSFAALSAMGGVAAFLGPAFG